jgi:hypothetical protein
MDIRRPDLDKWGVYCPHGKKIVEAIPAEHTCGGKPQPIPRVGPFEAEPEREYCKACYPEGRKVLPWACEKTGCDEAAYDREMQEEIDRYYEEMRQSYYG